MYVNGIIHDFVVVDVNKKLKFVHWGIDRLAREREKEWDRDRGREKQKKWNVNILITNLLSQEEDVRFAP